MRFSHGNRESDLIMLLSVLQILYLLLNYGVSYTARGIQTMERADNLFRIRLSCQLLRVCGTYFTQGHTRTKLNCYLLYLVVSLIDSKYWLVTREIILI